jgi:hypothetical protein
VKTDHAMVDLKSIQEKEKQYSAFSNSFNSCKRYYSFDSALVKQATAYQENFEKTLGKTLSSGSAGSVNANVAH